MSKLLRATKQQKPLNAKEEAAFRSKARREYNLSLAISSLVIVALLSVPGLLFFFAQLELLTLGLTSSVIGSVISVVAGTLSHYRYSKMAIKSLLNGNLQ